MEKDQTIKGQRLHLERLQERLGDDRQTAQFAAALHEQNYDRAARIAHAEGPYLSPEKAEVAEEASEAAGGGDAIQRANSVDAG